MMARAKDKRRIQRLRDRGIRRQPCACGHGGSHPVSPGVVECDRCWWAKLAANATGER